MAANKRVDWSGVFTAMVTPFGSDDAIDFNAVELLIETLIRDGVSGVVVAGSTGEFYSMSDDERLALFRAVKRAAAGRIKFIAGTSALSLKDTLALTEAAKSIGADGCMVLPPTYSLPTPREIRAYFAEVAEVGAPIMVYNNPGRTGVNIPPALAVELSQIENIVAYKEAARDLYAVAETYYATRTRWQHFAGLEPYGSALMTRGAAGLVSTISNVCAREVVAYHQAYLSGDTKTLSNSQLVIDKLYHLLPSTGLSNFAYVKGAMQALGRPGGVPRAPHIRADAAKVATIRAGIHKIYEEAALSLPLPAPGEALTAA
ncbi:MAG: dihydrodipicolinate synthase family protein [Gammaproteobacteria bacterium]